MPTQSSTLSKYLRHYGEPESQQIPATQRRYGEALIIPCYNESTAVAAKLRDLFGGQGRLLVIVVINAPPTTEALPDSLAANEAFAASIEALGETPAHSDPLKWVHCADGNSVLLVNRYQKGLEIPSKQGVGLARKIAADIACQLIANDVLQSKWIYSTDADAELPARYFQASSDSIQQHTNRDNTATHSGEVCAALFPFNHLSFTHESHQQIRQQSPQQANQATNLRAIQLYEFSMHYYVAALLWCQSPYAFYSIGSTLIINSHHYAKVRGFPKRAAGEDFYLLNKLAKLGVIYSLTEPVIKLEARVSSRTPFGTGQAIQTISNLGSAEDEYLYYSPQTFLYLRQWLKLIPQLWQHRQLTPATALATVTSSIDAAPEEINAEILVSALLQQNILTPLAHGFKQCPSSAHFVRHLHDYFDGFRSLKLIHWLRDNHFPSITQKELIDALQRQTFYPIFKALEDKILCSDGSLIPPPAGLYSHFARDSL